MENSQELERVIELGKAIVKELKLEPGVDTLARWMSHYIAEKIVEIESTTGEKKSNAEKECFETILKLWDHRRSAAKGNSFLEEFEPLFETLEKLNPDNEKPFFIPPIFEFETPREKAESESIKVQNHFESALTVDRLARSLIYSLLSQGVTELELPQEREEVIRKSIESIDYPEQTIIKFTSDYDKYLESQKEDKEDETKDKIRELQRRIDDLEEFTSLRDSLLEKYSKQIEELRIGQKKDIDKAEEP